MVALALAAHVGHNTALVWVKEQLQGAKFDLGKDSPLTLKHICRDNEGYNDRVRSDEAMVLLLVKTLTL
jgi:hypothetical protein